MKNFMSKQKAMAKKVLAAPDGTTVRLCVIVSVIVPALTALMRNITHVQ